MMNFKSILTSNPTMGAVQNYGNAFAPVSNPTTGAVQNYGNAFAPATSALNASLGQVNPRAQSTVNSFVNTPRSIMNSTINAMPSTMRSVTSRVSAATIQTPQNQAGFIKNNPRYIKNQTRNYNGMSYDNTTGPRPMAPINPKGFSNIDNVKTMFNSSYPNTPLSQSVVDVDPMTGQPINPLSDQSTNNPMVPGVDSAMSPIPNPSGVQTDSIAPYYGLSN